MATARLGAGVLSPPPGARSCDGPGPLQGLPKLIPFPLVAPAVTPRAELHKSKRTASRPMPKSASTKAGSLVYEPLGPPGSGKPKRLPGRENIVVRQSKLHGRGLFAKRAFAKGEKILQYMGERIDKKESERRTDAQWETGRVYTFELNKTWDIDGAPAWNVARLANYSCDPNAESENDRGRAIWVVALRPIAAGEEITYDYNFPFVDPPPVCRCGAAKCRGYIVGHEHLKPLNRWLKDHGKPTVKA